MSNNISSISTTPTWENIKERALRDENLNADIRIGAQGIQVHNSSLWRRFAISMGLKKAPIYPSREETLVNLREQLGLNFSEQLRHLIQETGIKPESEEYNTLITCAMQSFEVITQKLTASIATPTISTSQAIQVAHQGTLNSLILLRQHFSTPQFTPQFCQTSNGKWSVLQLAPHPENFVLSGGGVKGAGYVGWFKAAEKYGLLKNLKRLAGSSAGAMTAALIATGMNAEELEQASERTSFWSILTGTSNNDVVKATTKLDRKGWVSYFSFSGTYAVDCLNKEMVSSIKKYFHTFEKQDVFTEKLEGIQGLNTSEKERLTQLYQKIMLAPSQWLWWAFSQKKPATYMITFQDLAALAKLDSRFKELTITGFSSTTHQEKYFNAKNTPTLEIATAVRASMALPGAFSSVMIGEELISDGGIGSNTPAEVFNDFSKENTLVLQFDNKGYFYQNLHDPREASITEGMKGWIAAKEEEVEEALVDNPQYTRDMKADDQKSYDAGPNAMMVAEGDLSTMSFTANQARIRHAHRQAELRATESFFLRQNQGVDHIFSSLEEAMKAMSSTELTSINEFYGTTPPPYRPSNEGESHDGEVFPLSTEGRRAIHFLLSTQDRLSIVQAAQGELARRA